jgi:hypothetical protein
VKRENDDNVTRGPDEKDEPQEKGGKAAERLRQFLAERFGDDAPAIPPDEDEQEDPNASTDSDEGSDRKAD